MSGYTEREIAVRQTLAAQAPDGPQAPGWEAFEVVS